MKKWFIILLMVLVSPLYAAPVNINVASAKDISKSLNGVGKVRAQAIVEYREKNGEFKTVEDVLNVKGINQKILEKNRQDILIK